MVRQTPRSNGSAASVAPAALSADGGDDLHALLAELVEALCRAAAVAVVEIDADGSAARVLAVRAGSAAWSRAAFTIEAGTAIQRALADPARFECVPAADVGMPIPAAFADTQVTLGQLGERAGRPLLGLVLGPDDPDGASHHARALAVAREVARCLAAPGTDGETPQRALEALARRLETSTSEEGFSDAANRDARARLAAVLLAFEQERTAIGRTLQHSVMQSLAALKFGLEHSSTLLDREDHGGAVRVMRDLVPQLRQVIDEVRTLSFDTRPPLLDDAGAVSAVQWLCREWAERHPDTRLELECALVNENIPAGLGLPVFRTVQLALDNVARHARSPRVIVALGRKGARLEVEIVDEGVGFDAALAAPPGAVGLMCLNERVSHSGGTARILSRPGQGTIVQARWPLSGQQETTQHA